MNTNVIRLTEKNLFLLNPDSVDTDTIYDNLEGEKITPILESVIYKNKTGEYKDDPYESLKSSVVYMHNSTAMDSLQWRLVTDPETLDVAYYGDIVNAFFNYSPSNNTPSLKTKSGYVINKHNAYSFACLYLAIFKRYRKVSNSTSSDNVAVAKILKDALDTLDRLIFLCAKTEKKKLIGSMVVLSKENESDRYIYVDSELAEGNTDQDIIIEVNLLKENLRG